MAYMCDRSIIAKECDGCGRCEETNQYFASNMEKELENIGEQLEDIQKELDSIIDRYQDICDEEYDWDLDDLINHAKKSYQNLKEATSWIY